MARPVELLVSLRKVTFQMDQHPMEVSHYNRAGRDDYFFWHGGLCWTGGYMWDHGQAASAGQCMIWL